MDYIWLYTGYIWVADKSCIIYDRDPDLIFKIS